MNPTERLPPGLRYRDSCAFCGARWGDCSCDFDEVGPDGIVPPDARGFDWEEQIFITQPNVSVCGRFFVEPFDYYGPAFTEAAAKYGWKLGEPVGDDPFVRARKAFARVSRVLRAYGYGRDAGPIDVLETGGWVFALEVPLGGHERTRLLLSDPREFETFSVAIDVDGSVLVEQDFATNDPRALAIGLERWLREEHGYEPSPSVAYARFVRDRIQKDGLSFHPDTRFDTYVRFKDGSRVFSDEQAARLQAEHDSLCGCDYYAVALDVFEDWEAEREEARRSRGELTP